MPGSRLNAAFYADSVAAFLRASDDEVYAPLASPHGYTLAPEQLSAWRLQLPVLRTSLAALDTAPDCPIVLTRSMRAARRWIRRQRRGPERAGLVAPSSAQQLKPHAIDIRVNIDPVHWFWSPPRDTRSSPYLEDAATELQVQGLELNWTIITWDADLRWRGSDWSYHSFRGAKWTDVKKPERRQYLKNAYRVLLTRARQGMVIFVPPGANRDRMQSPSRNLSRIGCAERSFSA